VVPRRQGRGSVIFFGNWGIPVPFCTRSDLRLSRCPCTAFFSRIFFEAYLARGWKKKKLMPAFVFFFLLFPAQTSPCQLEEDPPRGSFLLYVMEGVFNGFLVPFLPSTPLLISTAVSF